MRSSLGLFHFKTLLGMTLMGFMLQSCTAKNAADQIAQKSYGITLEAISGDKQVIENPNDLAEELVVKVKSADNTGMPDLSVKFELVNADSGASVLAETVVTDADGLARTKVRAGDDFGKKAFFKATVANTNASYVFTVSVKDKIIPEKLTIVKTQDVVAGKTTLIKFQMLGAKGRPVEAPDFDTEFTVTFNSPSNAPSKAIFSPDINSRVVSIKNGQGSIAVSSQVAEDITIGLFDHGPIAVLEGKTGRSVDLTETAKLKVVPDIPSAIIIEKPLDATTDTPAGVKVHLEDQYANKATNYTGPISVELHATGTASVNGNAAKANISFVGGETIALVGSQKVETVQLSLANPSMGGVDVASTQTLKFNVGMANKVVLLNPIDGTVDGPISVSVEVQDQYGNINDTFSGRVKLLFDSSTAYATSNSGLIDILNGRGSIDIRDTKNETVNLTLFDAAGLGLNVSSKQDVYFEYGIANKFVFSSTLFEGTADNPVNVKVYAQDAFGNLVKNFMNDVRINSTGNATGTGVVDIANGVGSMNITNRTTGVYDLSLSDAGSNLDVTNSASLKISPGATKQIVLQDPLDGTIDNPVVVTLEAMDAWGNRATSFSDSVRLETTGSAALEGGGDAKFTAGLAKKNISDLKNETVNLTISDFKKLGLDVSSSQDLYFSWGKASKFVILDPRDGTVDNPIQVTVETRDQGDNLVKNYNGNVSLTVNKSGEMALSPGAKVGLISVANGVGRIGISDKVAESVTLGLFDSSFTMIDCFSTQDVTFAPGIVTKLAILEPVDGTVDKPVTVTIQAQDQFGNKNPAFDGVISIVADGMAKGAGLVQVAGGQGTANISDTLAETVNLSLVDSNQTGLDVSSKKDVIFAPGMANQFAIKKPLDAVVGTQVPVTVEVLDQYGNFVNTFEKDVTLFTSGSATVANFGLVDIKFGRGVLNISDIKAESVSLTLFDSQGTSLSTTSTQSVIFSPGIVTQFVLIDPVDGTVDAPISVMVQAQDQYGNINYDYESDVTLRVSGQAQVESGGLVNIMKGVGRINVSDTLAETINLSLSDTQFTGNTVTSTQSVVFAPGETTQLVILDPTDGTVDAPISVKIQAKDQYNNNNILYTGGVTLVANGLAVVPNGGAVTLKKGVGEIAVTDTKAETVDLTLSDSLGSGKDVTSRQSVIFAPGAVKKFIIVKPNDGTVDFPIPVRIEAHDQYENINVSYNGAVTLASTGSATGAGLVSINSGVGLINISDKKVESVTLSLVDTALTMVNVSSTQTVFFASGLVTKFAILDPYDGTVDNPISVTVQAQDQYGNINPGYYSDITLVLSGSATGGGLIDIVAGSGTIQIADHVAETVNLTLRDSEGSGRDTSSVQNVVFGAGLVKKMVIIDPLDGTVDAQIPVRVEAQDQFGNKNPSFSGRVSFVTSGSAIGGGVIELVSGSADVRLSDTKAETVSLSLIDSSNTGLNVSSTQDVLFSAGVVTKFVILKPTDGTVDAPITVTVQAQDQFGNRNFKYGIGVTLTSTGSATGGGLVDIQNGSGMMQISDTKAESVTLRLSDTELTGRNVDSTQTVVFGGGVVTKMVILNPTDGSVDASIPVTVEAQDQFGNRNISYNGSVKLNLSGNATGGGNLNISNGIVVVDINDQLAETVNLSLSDIAGTGLNVTSKQDVVFSPGVVKKFAILQPQDGTVDAAIAVIVEARDQYGNKNPDYQKDVTLLTEKSAKGGGLVNITNGAGSLEITDTVAETVRLTLSDTMNTNLDVSSNIYIKFDPGISRKMVILKPLDGTTDAAVSVTVEVRDQYDNFTPSFNNGVKMLATGSAQGSGEMTIVNGRGTLNISDEKVEIVQLSLQDTHGTNLNVTSTQNIAFGAGRVAKFTIIDPTDGTTDSPIKVTVESQDRFGNVNLNYNGSVFLNTTGQAIGGGLVSLVNGSGYLMITDTKAETVILTLTDGLFTGFDVTSTQNVKFSPGVPRKLVILNPRDGNVDAAIRVTVEAQDAGGNRTIQYSAGVTLNASGSATGDGLVNIVSGSGYLDIADRKAEIVNLSLTDSENTTLDTSSTQDVIFTAGAPFKLVIIDPADGTVDAPIAVRVQSQDQYGNRNFNYDNLVQLNTDGSATGGGTVQILNGEGVISISDHVAQTVNLSLADIFNSQLNVSSKQDVVFGYGAMKKFKIVNPVDGTVDNPIVVTVRAEDQYGNLNLAYAGQVKLISSGTVVPVNNTGIVDVVSGVGLISISATLPQKSDLTLQDFVNTGKDVSSTEDVIFKFGTVTKFTILNPQDGTVDNPIKVTVEARDKYNNKNTDYAGRVNLNATGGATGAGVIDLVSGSGFKNVSSTLSQTVIFTLTDSQGTNFNVSDTTEDAIYYPGVVTKFVLLDPTDGTVDAPITVTVQAQDQYGNLNLTYGGSVKLVTSGTATGGGTFSIVAGTGSLSISDSIAETVNLSLQDSANTGKNVTSTQSVIFAPGGATQFAILQPNNGTVDNAVTVVVEARDQFGNKCLNYQNDVSILATGSSGAAFGSGLVDIINGAGSIGISSQLSQTVTLKLVDSQGTNKVLGPNKSIVFAPGVVTKFVIIDPTDGSVDSAVDVSVQAQDQFGNLNDGFTGSINLAASGVQGGAVTFVSGGSLVSLANGVGLKSISTHKAQMVNLSLTDTTPSSGKNFASTQQVQFVAGAVTKFFIAQPLDGTVDAPITVTVEARDQYDNVNTSAMSYGVNLVATGAGGGAVTGVGAMTITSGYGTKNISSNLAQTVNLSLTDGIPATNKNVSSTASVVFNPGAVTKLTILPPSNGTVDATVPVKIQAQDQFGNKNSSYTKNFVLNGTGSGAGSVSGIGQLAFVSGEVTANIGSHKAQTVALSLADTSPASNGSVNLTSAQNVVFNSGQATNLVLLQPSNGTVDAAIPVSVEARDQYDNKAMSYTGSVTLTATGPLNTVSGGGTLAISAGAGSLNISSQKAQTVTLSISNPSTASLTLGANKNVDFGAGIVTQLVLLQPAAGTVDAGVSVTVEGQDKYGNKNSAFTGDVKLTTNPSTTVSTVPANSTISLASGTGSITVSSQLAQSVTLGLSNSSVAGLSVTSTKTVSFGAGAVTKYVIVDPADGTVDNAITVSIQALDQFNNLNTNFNGSIKVAAAGGLGGAVAMVGGSSLVTIANGVGTKDISTQLAQTVNLSLLDTSPSSGKTIDSTQQVIFAPGVVSKFVIIDPNDGTVDTPISVSVQAQDQYGNKNLTYGGSVKLLTSGSATGGGTVTIVAGAGSLSIADTVAETVNLSLQDSANTGKNISSTQSVVFSPGGATQFAILQPVNGTVDSAVPVTVEARDQFGNKSVSYQSDVSVTATGSQGAAFGAGLVDIVNGSGVINISSQLSQNVTIALVDSQNTQKTLGASKVISFAPGVVSKFVIIDPTDGNVDTAINVSVQAQDQYSNLNSGFTGSINLSATGVAGGAITFGGGSPLVSISAGVGTKSISSQKAQIVNLSLADTTPASGKQITSTQQVVFGAGAVTKFVIVPPTSGSVDGPITVSVEARDQYDNVNTNPVSYNINLGATGASGGTVTGGGAVTISSGYGSKNISSQLAQTVNLSLTDGNPATGKNVTSTSSVVFTPGAVSKLVILAPAAGTVDATIAVKVQAQDQFGNKNSGYDRSFILNTSGSAGGAVTGAGQLTFASGEVTTNIGSQKAQTVALSLADTSPATNVNVNLSSTQNAVFGAGVTKGLVILQPTNGTVDAAIPVTVESRDQYDNKSNYTGTVSLAATGPLNTVSGGGTVNFTSGSGTLNISSQKAQTVTLHISNPSVSGLAMGPDKTVDFGFGATKQLVILQPVDGTVDAGVVVTVEAQDQYGNKNTNFMGDVTLTMSPTTTVTTVPANSLVSLSAGSGTVTVQSQLAQTVALGLTNSTVTGLTISSSKSVLFKAGSVTKMVITGYTPTSATTDNPVIVTVEAQDRYGNKNTDFTGSVTMSTTGAATGGGSVSISGGSGTKSISDTLVESTKLTLSAPYKAAVSTPSIDVSSTVTISFAVGAPFKFTIVSAPDVTVDNSTTVTVKVQDKNGNNVSGYNNDVKLLLSGSAQYVTPATGIIDIVNGSGTITIKDTLAETVNLSLSDTLTTNLNVGSTKSVNFTYGAAKYIEMLSLTNTNIDNSVTVNMRVIDQFSNQVMNFTGSVTISSDKAGVTFNPSSTISLTNGAGNTSIRDLTAETVTLTTSYTGSPALDTSTKGSKSVTFTYGAAAKLDIDQVTLPTGATTDAPAVIVLKAYDQGNNFVANFGGSVSLKSTLNGKVASVITGPFSADNAALTFSNGTATGYVKDIVKETVSLSMNTPNPAGLNVTTTRTVFFNYGALAKYVILPPPNTGTSATPVTMTIEAQDQNGNYIDNINTGSVSVSVDGLATINGAKTKMVGFASGHASVTVSDTKKQNVNISLSNPTPSGVVVTSTQVIVFGSGAAYQWVITKSQSDTTPAVSTDFVGTIDNPMTVYVQAQDLYGNLCDTYSSSVKVTLTGNATANPATRIVQVSNGFGSIPISDLTAQTIQVGLEGNVTPTLSLPASTVGMTFGYGIPAKVTISPPVTPNTIDVNAVTVQVNVLDKGNNIVLGYDNSANTATVKLTTTGGATGAGNVTVQGGTGTRAVADLTAETVTLRVTGTLCNTSGVDCTSTQNIEFTPGNPTQLLIDQPTDGSVDAPIPITMRLMDKGNNLITNKAFSFNLNITGATGTTTGSGTLSISTSTGTASASITNTRPDTITLGISNTTSAVTTNTRNVSFAPGAAKSFTMLTPSPSSPTIDDSVVVTAKAYDQFGNLATTWQSDVDLNATGSVTGAGTIDIVNGVGTKTIRDLVAETVSLSLANALGGTGINLTTSGTKSLTFAYGALSKFTFDTIAATASVDDYLTGVPFVVRARDQGNNLVANYSGSIKVTSNGAAHFNGVTTNQELVVNFTNGVASGNLIQDKVAETVTLGLKNLPGYSYTVSDAKYITFLMGALKSYQFTRNASGVMNSGRTDLPVVVSIKAVDKWGNQVTDAWQDVTVNTASPTAVFSNSRINIVGGVGTVTVSDSVAETVGLSLSTTSETPSGAVLTDAVTVDFAWGYPAKIVIYDPVDQSVDVGTQVKVEVRDSADNRIPKGGTVTLTAGGSAYFGTVGTKSTSVAINSATGTGVVDIKDQVAESVALSLSNPSVTGAIATFDSTSTQTVAFGPGQVSQIIIYDPLDGSVLDVVPITIEARDQYGNKNNTYTNTVKLKASGLSLSLMGTAKCSVGVTWDQCPGWRAPDDPLSITLTAGRAEAQIFAFDQVSRTSTLSFDKTVAIPNVSLDSTQSVYLAPGSPVKYAFIKPANGTTDGPIFVTIEAQDDRGQRVPTFDGKVYVNIDKGGFDSSRAVDIIGGKGVLEVYDAKPETVNLTFTDIAGTAPCTTKPTTVRCRVSPMAGESATGYSTTATFTKGQVAKIVVLPVASAFVRDQVTVQVQALRSDNTLADSFRGVFTLTLTGSATGGGAIQLVNGIGSLTIMDFASETITIGLTDTLGTGIDVSSKQTMYFKPGVRYRAYVHCFVNNNGSIGAEKYDFSTDDSPLCRVGTYDMDWNWVGGYDTPFSIGVKVDAYSATPSRMTVNGYVDPFVSPGVEDLTVLNTKKTINLSVVQGQVKFTAHNSRIESASMWSMATTDSNIQVYYGASILWSPGKAVKYVIKPTTAVGAGQEATIIIEAQNANGIPVPTHTGVAELVTSGSATGAGLVVISNGRGYVKIKDNVAETVNLSVKNADSLVLDVTSTRTQQFTIGTAAKFVIATPPAGTTDNPINITVKAVDSAGNLVSTYNGSVNLNLAAGSSAKLPNGTKTQTVTLVNGTQTIAVSDTVAETVALTLTNVTGTTLDVTSTQNVTFAPGLPTKFVIKSITGSYERGDSIPVTVEAQNANSAVVTSYTGFVELKANGSATSSSIVKLVNGVGTVNISDNVAETVTVSLNDYFGTGFNSTSTQTVVIATGSATKLVITPTASTPWNTTAAISVAAQNKNGLVVTGYNGTPSLTATGTGTISGTGSLTFNSGVATKQISDTKAETVALNISGATGLSITTANQVFTDPVPTKIVFVTPATGNTENALPVTLKVIDAAGNVCGNVSDKVTLKSTGSVTGVGQVTFVAGQVTVNLSDSVAEIVTLSLASWVSTSFPAMDVTATVAATFQAVPPSTIAIDPPTSGTTDSAVTVTVKAKTASGNVASSYSGVLGFVVTNAAAGTITAPTLVSITNGVGTISVASTLNQTVTLGLSDTNGILSGTSTTLGANQNLTFGLGAANKIVMATNPDASSIVDENFATMPVVKLTDAKGNTITSNNTGTITVKAYKDSTCTTVGSGILNGIKSITLSSGVATYSGLNYSVAEQIWLKFTITGVAGMTGATTICQSAGGVYAPLTISTTYTSIATTNSMDVAVTGGVPPLGSFVISMNASGSSLGTASSCATGSTCTKFVAGLQGGDVEDDLTITDSEGHSVTAAFIVTGPVLTFTNPFTDLNFGTPVLDTSRNFTAKNIGSIDSSTGALTATLTTTNSAMWSMVATGCNGASLNVDQTCVIAVTFKASTGTGGVSGTQYTATLTVQGASGGKKSIILRGTKP